MNDDQLLRYSRQIMLPDVDIDGQEALLCAHVIVVGLGGLGCPAALYLAAAGVGKLTLIDSDRVELSNLQRQIAHTVSALNTSKVESAAERIRTLNAEISIETHAQHWDSLLAGRVLPGATLVLDCTDNLATRLELNRECHRRKIPLVFGAAIGLEGQLSVFDFRQSEAPCYQCLYTHTRGEDLTCAANGILAPVVGVIGSMQALEAIKLIVGFGECLTGRLLILDAKYLQWRELQLQKRSDCPVCVHLS